MDCEKYEAEWLLFWDGKYILMCQECLDSYIFFEGEVNLEFWHLPLGDLATIFAHVNRTVAYWKEMYERAYRGEFRSEK
jgi:hypothetical protein